MMLHVDLTKPSVVFVELPSLGIDQAEDTRWIIIQAICDHIDATIADAEEDGHEPPRMYVPEVFITCPTGVHGLTP